MEEKALGFIGCRSPDVPSLHLLYSLFVVRGSDSAVRRSPMHTLMAEEEKRKERAKEMRCPARLCPFARYKRRSQLPKMSTHDGPLPHTVLIIASPSPTLPPPPLLSLSRFPCSFFPREPRPRFPEDLSRVAVQLHVQREESFRLGALRVVRLELAVAGLPSRVLVRVAVQQGRVQVAELGPGEGPGQDLNARHGEGASCR